MAKNATINTFDELLESHYYPPFSLFLREFLFQFLFEMFHDFRNLDMKINIRIILLFVYTILTDLNVKEKKKRKKV